MTTELTQPQSELGPVPANGQGQSQGHRRRRRRRKNKSSQAAARSRRSSHNSLRRRACSRSRSRRPRSTSRLRRTRAGRQGGHQHQDRKKKKFFQKGSATAAQPGNSISAPPQGKRKTRQKGPREFVGPMDHSYRIVNGNVADGPPSTIQIGKQRPQRQLLPGRLSSRSRGRSPRGRAHAHLLLHRGSVLPGQDSGDGPQAGREGGVCEGRQGVRGQADRPAGGRAAQAAGL